MIGLLHEIEVDTDEKKLSEALGTLDSGTHAVSEGCLSITGKWLY